MMSICREIIASACIIERSGDSIKIEIDPQYYELFKTVAQTESVCELLSKRVGEKINFVEFLCGT